MKLLINLLKFIGILVFIPLCIFHIEGFIPMSWREILFVRLGFLSLIMTLIFVILICRKQFKKEQFKEVNVFRTILFAFILAVILHPLSSLIDCYGYTPNEISQEGISFVSANAMIFILIFCPILEELGIRIVVINNFKDKLPNWLLMIGTSFIFSILHIKSVNLMVDTFIFGVILSYLFIQSGNGLLLILTHFFTNLLTYIPRQYYVSFYIFLLGHIYIPIIVFALVLIVLVLKRKAFKALLLSTVRSGN